MKYYDLKTQFGNYKVSLQLGKYAYGHCDTPALELITEEGEPFARITVNLPGYFLNEDEAFLDTNNCSWAEKFIKDNKLGTPLGWEGHSGWCEYPAYRLNINRIVLGGVTNEQELIQTLTNEYVNDNLTWDNIQDIVAAINIEPENEILNKINDELVRLDDEKIRQTYYELAKLIETTTDEQEKERLKQLQDDIPQLLWAKHYDKNMKPEDYDQYTQELFEKIILKGGE